MEISFDDISTSSLHIDVVLKGGAGVGKGYEPLNRIIPGIGNEGGFRPIWSKDKMRVLACVLVTTGKDLDWPDYLDETSGVLTYYGDNRKAGSADFRKTRKRGNEILENVFDWQQSRDPVVRAKIPPLLIFQKVANGHDYQFKGLAVPSVNGLGHSECLTAIWKIDEFRQRFLNYRAKMTIINLDTVPRDWLLQIKETESSTGNLAPGPWLDYVKSGKFFPLEGERSKMLRGAEEQVPDPVKHPQEYLVLKALYENLDAKGRAGNRIFEYCAIQLCRWCDPNIKKLEITRASRDGGRDGIGRYKIGNERSSHCFVDVEFYIEAKKYDPWGNGVGVGETSRLISRIKNRQFGFLVTTGFVADQAYREILEDGHPVVIMAGIDVARLLIEHDIKTNQSVNDWLNSFEHPY
jgi:Restriction endonuclease AspBHI N-terminal/Restriction endonuclease